MKYLYLLLPLLFFIGSGCTPDVPPPPIERNDLVVRFFRNLRNNNGEASAMQGQKLYAMDKRNYYLRHLISVQQANGYIRKAQGELNSGRLKSATRCIADGLKHFPENTELLKEYDKLRKLRHAEKLFAAMRTAPNPAAMNSALAATEAGLSGIESTNLRKYINSYKKNIERWNRHKSSGNISTDKVPIRSFDDK